MQQPKLYEMLHSFIAEDILNGQGEGLDENTPLLEWGVLDSLTMMSLLAFIENKCDMIIPHNEVKPENFQNLASLVILLERLSKQTK